MLKKFINITQIIWKNEENIICDWVNHYLNLDFDKIIIYDNLSNIPIKLLLNNNNLLNDKIEILIENTEFINQKNIYTECINNNKDLDWLLLCDADEFLYIKDNTIKNFLNNFSEDTCTILINWLVYGTSNNQIYNKSQSIYEQFTKREDYTHFWNIFVKSFVRPKLIIESQSPHITYNKNYIVAVTFSASQEAEKENSILVPPGEEKETERADHPVFIWQFQ
jgi:hypothetical protein